jgi:hypothetical protein
LPTHHTGRETSRLFGGTVVAGDLVMKLSFFLGCVALVAGCSSSTEGVASTPASSGARGVSIVALGDGKTTTVTAVVVDDRAQPIRLENGEVVSAKIGDSVYVLVLDADERGDPLYRASAPAMLHYADIDVSLTRKGSTTSLAIVRVTEPFTVANAPSTLRIGDDLSVDLEHGTTALDGRPKIAFEGSCLAPTVPADAQTYGSYSSIRFDTGQLPIDGACDVTVAVSFVNERNVYTQSFASGLTPPARGLQERRFTVHVSR